jgi:Reverse transcriptase (RNA-dependent DNA polymerase)
MKDQIVAFCGERSVFNLVLDLVTAPLKVTDDIAKDLYRIFIVVLVLLDFSKAFDTVNFKLLGQKLKTSFFLSDLMDRSQCVHANGALPSFLPVTQGVRQGSILGFLLFSLFINDILTSFFFCKPI